MTQDKARELLAVQADFGGFYNGNAAKLILSEVQKERGQAAADQLIRDLHLDTVLDFKPGTCFDGVWQNNYAANQCRKIKQPG